MAARRVARESNGLPNLVRSPLALAITHGVGQSRAIATLQQFDDLRDLGSAYTACSPPLSRRQRQAHKGDDQPDASYMQTFTRRRPM